ncbi:MAG: hypothetical protein HY834_18550 [Devosia nanyangense]|uniref:Motility protein n=1 Tax=Devosia nanyangense TaxID=1228055 RepID=A0A933L4E8_9HYPH|nr:hypothetical protein [Devosia nanyangense]
MDAVAQLLAMKTAGTQQLAQIAVMRRAHQMDMQLIEMIDGVTSQAPAPAGQGRIVDKRA